MSSAVSFRLLSGLLVVCLGILLSLGATPAWSQATSSSSVVGLVTDQSGAAVPAADVKLVDNETQMSRTTPTNEAGRYVFVNVPSGTYTVRINKAGFALSETAGVNVTAGNTVTINAVLEVGTSTETVEVTATAAAELQTTNATVGTTLSGDSILFLPNLGRDVQTLATLQPAVTPSSGTAYGSGFTAGAFNDQNTYMLDGGNVSDDMAGNTNGYQTNFTGLGGTQTGGASSGVVPTPVESVEEVRVQVFSQTADFNNSVGSNVQMTTKRGTKDWHGAAYMFYFATDVGAANNWQNNHTPSTFNGVSLPYTPIISNHRDRFGGALGGPIVPFNVLGGKWYGFLNYEGLRFPNAGTFEALVPTAEMRAGVIQIPNASGQYVAYNLNPNPVTVNGVTYQPAVCPAGSCDPRGIGLNPIVSQMWQKEMPLPNDPSYGSGDGHNVEGYLSALRSPLKTNNYIGRVDHDFNPKWHFMTSYRYTRLVSLTANQVDIGGALPGDTLGAPAATAPRPQVDGYFVAGLTTSITPNVTNDFRFAYLRQFWQWGTAQAPPQVSGLGGAIELAGSPTASSAESTAGNALIPYNVNSQSIRQRFWDGQDKQITDNLSMLRGNHLFQYGGSYQRDFDYHMRTDNGIGINNQIIYWLGNYGQGNWTNSPYIPTTVPSSQYSSYENLYGEVLGIVAQSQVAYTRAGSALNLQPVGSVAFDQSIIPYYNLYFSDTWHLKPSVTFTYGLAYALEMPPYEINGKQVALVDSGDNLVSFDSYIAQREKAALAGQTYDPTLGFALVPNVGNGLKYPYNPFYGEFSPRAAIAWNPGTMDGVLGKLLGSRKTVIRAGYGRIYGRINGVNQVLVPLLGPGLLQGVVCNGAVAPSLAPAGTAPGTCLGTGQATPANAFRIGTDGLTAPLPAASPTLAQPFFPGGTNPNAGDATALDPNYRPNRTDNLSISFQRQMSTKSTLEVGYIGRISRNDYMEVNLDAVPYMETLGGQTFAAAYSALWESLCGGTYPCTSTVTPANAPVQPFFEAALGGTSSAYCKGYTSCTAAFATNQASNIKSALVSTLWSALNNAAAGQPWTGGRTMISSPLNGGTNQATSISLVGSYGWSNYNAVYTSFRTSDWHGLTAVSNFTWSRGLGTAAYAQYNSSTTAMDAYDLNANYGPQLFDVKFVYNASMYWQPPIFKGNRGIEGKLLGGWTLSPLFTAQSGFPIAVGYSPGAYTQAFGESSSSSINTNAENAVGAAPYTGTTSTKYGVTGSGGIGTNNPYGVNMFSNPAAVYSEFRPCILGIDTSCGGYANLRGMPRWNLDATLVKNFGIIKERVGATLFFAFTNVLNHNVLSNPTLSLTSPTTFGRITTQSNTPRNMEFGLRLHF
jgi:hypothetical protein